MDDNGEALTRSDLSLALAACAAARGTEALSFSFLERYPDLPVSRGQLARVLTALAAQEERDEVCTALTVQAAAEESPSAAQLHRDELQSAVEKAASRYGAVGVQVAVIEKGALTDTFVCGWAVKNVTAMTGDHKLRVASITKVAVAMAAFALAEDGTVDLDASIGGYWGVSAVNRSYPDDPVTLRTVLSHTSSIPCYGDDVSRSYSSVLKKLSSGGFSAVCPGVPEAWCYNNYAFSVLGMTLELASGRLLDDVMAEAFFTPLDMDASFKSGGVSHTELLCTLYRSDGSVGLSAASAANNVLTSDVPASNGFRFAGGLTLSAGDLAKLVCVLAGDGCFEGTRLLSADSVAQMEACLSQPVDMGTYQFYQAHPLRYQAGLYGRGGIYYHTGSAYGVYCCISYDPDTGDGVVVLTSGASGLIAGCGIYAVCDDILSAVYPLIV